MASTICAWIAGSSGPVPVVPSACALTTAGVPRSAAPTGNVVVVGATVVGGAVAAGAVLVGAAAGPLPPPEHAAIQQSRPAAPNTTAVRRACWKLMDTWLWGV